jgi:hypothetical protein
MARDRFLFDVSPKDVAIHAGGNTKEDAEVTARKMKNESRTRGNLPQRIVLPDSPNVSTIKVRMSKANKRRSNMREQSTPPQVLTQD